MVAPGRQGSQVISRSLRSWGRSSCANASAVKEPGHFEVRKSSSQVTGCTFFPQKMLTTFFSSPSKHRPPTLLIVSLSKCHLKPSDMVTMSVHTITEAKQGGDISSQVISQGGWSSSQVIWPGVPWCSATTAESLLSYPPSLMSIQDTSGHINVHCWVFKATTGAWVLSLKYNILQYKNIFHEMHFFHSSSQPFDVTLLYNILWHSPASA